jgi:hypothetical protein
VLIRCITTKSCAFLLAIVVVLLPPLIRATYPTLRAPESSTSFRLNRGFDMPESKWRMTPSVAETLDGALPHAALDHPPSWRTLPDAALPADHQYDRSPDPLRGPPLI